MGEVVAFDVASGAAAVAVEEVEAEGFLVLVYGVVSCGLYAFRPNRKISDTILFVGILWLWRVLGGEIENKLFARDPSILV